MDYAAIHKTLDILESQIRDHQWEAAADSAEHVKMLISEEPTKTKPSEDEVRTALCEDADGTGMGEVDDFVSGPREFDLGAQGA